MAKCKSCKKSFTQFNSLQVVCSPTCALAVAKISTAKRKKAETKNRLENLKTLGTHKKELQAIFNKWIRLTDKDQPCISCQRHHKGQYHAGHYRSVGSCAELRFEPDNVHKQCSACNNHLSGNLIDYRINLIKKIGLARVEWIEGPHEIKHYTIDDIKKLKVVYRAKIREIEKSKAA